MPAMRVEDSKDFIVDRKASSGIDSSCMRIPTSRLTHPKVGIAVRFLARSYCFGRHVPACREQRVWTRTFLIVAILWTEGS